MGLKEQMTLIFYQTGKNVGTSVSRSIIGPGCPRGAKMTLQQAKVAILMNEADFGDDRKAQFMISSGGFPHGGIPQDQDISRAKPLWYGHFAVSHRSVTGASENVTEMPSIVEDLDFSESNNPGIRISNTLPEPDVSYRFTSWTNGAPPDSIDVFIALQVEMEYLETSRSQKSTWEMDELTAEETQQ